MERLSVFVHDRAVATLECTDGHRHVLAYHPGVQSDQFVSLLMPVRTESYAYPGLHPNFHMNLPEGYLLSILKEQLGPHVGATPMSLLAVVGRNGIGRVKLAAVGADPTTPPMAFEVQSILSGDNSEAAFEQLVRRFATSGVSGVVPKFLTPRHAPVSATVLGEQHLKGTLATADHIIKGTTARLPGVAINEHLCMKVARLAGAQLSIRSPGQPAAAITQVSEDGQAIIVDRFDRGDDGQRLGMEDLCCLLGKLPDQKYDTTWESIANRISDVVRDRTQRRSILWGLADLILLSYALRNADCHSKNVALMYRNLDDIWLAPVYDMLSTRVYDDYALNAPGLSLAGRKTWAPGKELELFMHQRCELLPQALQGRIESICEAIVTVSPEVVRAANTHGHFRETGKRMLHEWNEGMASLRRSKTWVLPSLDALIEGARMSDRKPRKRPPREKIGRSPLLGQR